jgi:hypothetical protein
LDWLVRVPRRAQDIESRGAAASAGGGGWWCAGGSSGRVTPALPTADGVERADVFGGLIHEYRIEGGREPCIPIPHEEPDPVRSVASTSPPTVAAPDSLPPY